jgi:hypothetical protein
MRRLYDSALTMFVYLKGHGVLQYYFAVRDTYTAANEPIPRPAPVVPLESAGKTNGRRRNGRSAHI